jgi:hypothetical protein
MFDSPRYPGMDEVPDEVETVRTGLGERVLPLV